jgi:hypothetical protein
LGHNLKLFLIKRESTSLFRFIEKRRYVWSFKKIKFRTKNKLFNFSKNMEESKENEDFLKKFFKN